MCGLLELAEPHRKSAHSFPVGSQLVDESKFCVDLTGRKQKDLIDSDNLPHLLDLFNRWSGWGLDLRCKILVVRDGFIISNSNSEIINPTNKLKTLKS